MFARLDRLADLGTTIITISGGEPLLHPELDRIIAHVRRRGMIAGMITNGYLMPDEVSKKSLKTLDKKLQLLAEHADFHVNINSVVGGGIQNPSDALVVGRPAAQLGFTSAIGLLYDG